MQTSKIKVIYIFLNARQVTINVEIVIMHSTMLIYVFLQYISDRLNHSFQ